MNDTPHPICQEIEISTACQSDDPSQPLAYPLPDADTPNASPFLGVENTLLTSSPAAEGSPPPVDSDGFRAQGSHLSFWWPGSRVGGVIRSLIQAIAGFTIIRVNLVQLDQIAYVGVSHSVFLLFTCFR